MTTEHPYRHLYEEGGLERPIECIKCGTTLNLVTRDDINCCRGCLKDEVAKWAMSSSLNNVHLNRALRDGRPVLRVMTANGPMNVFIKDIWPHMGGL